MRFRENMVTALNSFLKPKNEYYDYPKSYQYGNVFSVKLSKTQVFSLIMKLKLHVAPKVPNHS